LTGVIVVVLVAALAFAAQRRTFAAYPPAPAGLAVLHRGEAAFIEGVAEVLFPPVAGLAIPGLDAQLPHYVDRHLAALPRAQRVQIRLLFAAVEHVTLVLPGEEPGGRRRFSRLSAASRIAVLQRLAHHRNGLIRLLVTALRSVLVLGYLGHPANLHQLGLSPFEIESVVSEAEWLFPRVGALKVSIPYGPEDRSDPASARGARPPLEPNGARHRAYDRAGRVSR